MDFEMSIDRRRAGYALSWLVTFLLLGPGFGMGCSEGGDGASDAHPRGAVPAPASTGELARKPLNVLLITVDTTRADALTPYGQPRLTSPHIDELSQRGVLFEQADSAAPLTLPSHATILTGRFPFTHGARSNAGDTLPEGVTTLAERLKERGYRTSAEISAVVLNATTRLNQGFDEYRDLSASDIERIVATARDREGHIKTQELPERAAGDVTRHAKDFVRRNRHRPFFLWAHYFDPHVFYLPRPKFREAIPDSPYHAEISYMDEAIGALLDEIDRLGLRERTLVVLVGDHGESLGEHDEETHAYYLYESTLRVPLLIAGPRKLVPARRRISSLVRTADIAPTILDLLDLPAIEGVDGRSLRPLIQGETEDLELVAYSESFEIAEIFGSSPLRALRIGDWKYVHKLEPELYDLAKDPSERENLAATHPDRLMEMRKQLERIVEDAPSPPSHDARSLDPAALRELKALGYLTGGMEKQGDDESYRSTKLRGPDPGALGEDIKIYSAASANQTAGRHALAIEGLTTLRAKYPDRPGPRILLAGSLIELGRMSEARTELDRALEQVPCSTLGRSLLSRALLAMNDPAADLKQLAEAAAACPDSFWFLNNHAYALATYPDVPEHDRQEAIRVATRAVELSGGTDPGVLDTLASAYAANGDHESALETAERALSMILEQHGASEILDKLRADIARYQALNAPDPE